MRFDETRIEVRASVIGMVVSPLAGLTLGILFVSPWVGYINWWFLAGALPVALILSPFRYRASIVEVTDESVVGPPSFGWRRVRIDRRMISGS